jgi:hypothetical protein
MGVTRKLVVGVTGHRPNRLPLGEARIARRLYLVLEAIRSGTPPGVTRVALSPLAEGADRLFAEAALGLGYKLHANLPFKSDDYETTFGDAASTPVYRMLLHRAAEVTELPGTLEDSKAAYESVGQATVEESDILVAVWDGQGAAGRGGTPEIIAHAMGCQKPVIWVDARREQLPRMIRRLDPSGAVLSDKLTSAGIAELAAGQASPR